MAPSHARYCGRTLLLMNLVVWLAMHAIGGTKIDDVIYSPGAVAPLSGELTIVPSLTFTAADGKAVSALKPITIRVKNGKMLATLEPNDTGIPGGTYYKVTYKMRGGLTANENWVVPTVTTSLSISAVSVVAGTDANPLTMVDLNGSHCGDNMHICRISVSADNRVKYQEPVPVGIRRGPVLNSLDYDFPPRFVQRALTAGNLNTVELSPCPLGVNGTDEFHFLYISGETGSPEAVLITGGSCVSGALTGTVNFTPSYDHAATSQIQSATAGVQETAQILSSTGGVIRVTRGTYPLHARISLASRIELVGAGKGVSILSVPPNEFAASAPWQIPTSFYSVIAAFVNAHDIHIRDLTIDMNGAHQAAAPDDNVSGIAIINNRYSLISNIEVKHSPILRPNTALPVAVLGTSSYNIIENSDVVNQVCDVFPSGGTGGFWVGGSHNRVVNSRVSNGCNSPYVAGIGSVDIVFQGDTFELGASTMSALAQAFAADNSIDAKFIRNSCVGNGIGPACFAVTTDDRAPDSTNTIFEDNAASNCGYGYLLDGNPSLGSWSRRTSIEGGSVLGCSSGGIYIKDNIDALSISGVEIVGNAAFGIRTESHLDASIRSVTIDHNLIQDNGTGIDSDSGIWIAGTEGSIPVVGLKIVGNVILDSRSSGKTQRYGVYFSASKPPSPLTILDNTFSGNAIGSVIWTPSLP
jgi:hypothetical protein